MALAVGLMTTAQVKIGTDVQNINPASILELESSTQGVNFPKLALTSTTVAAPLAGGVFVEGMVVYNTNTTITGTNDVTSGLYVSSTNAWVKLGAGASSNLYTADGTLTGARTVNQNNNDLTFTTGTAKTIVNGKFQTTGAIFTKYRVATTLGEAAVLPDDYIIDIQVSGPITAFTGVLPNPTTVPAGRVIILRNSSARVISGTVGTYTFTGLDNGYLVTNSNLIQSNISMMLYCDGTKWVRICE